MPASPLPEATRAPCSRAPRPRRGRALSARRVRAQAPAPRPAANAPATDLDRFMAQALQRRDIDRKTLSDYVLDEVEAFEVLGPGRVPDRPHAPRIHLVRARRHPRAQPASRSTACRSRKTERRAYEDRWVKSEEGRRKFRTEREAKREQAGKPPALSAPSINEPRFISESYFMDFKFEPGNYYLAGKETLDGQEVLKIDYLPTKLFNDDRREVGGRGGQKARGRGRKPKDAKDAKTKTRSRKRRRSTSGRRRSGRRRRKLERGHRAQDEQVLAGHALGRPGVAPDREVHVRQRLAGFPARRLARARWTTSAPRCRWASPSPASGCRATCPIHAGVTIALGPMEVSVQARVLELSQGGRLVEGHGARRSARSASRSWRVTGGGAAGRRGERSPRSASTATPRSSDEAVLKLAGVTIGPAARRRRDRRDRETAARQRPLRRGPGPQALSHAGDGRGRRSCWSCTSVPASRATGEPPSVARRLRSRLMFFPILQLRRRVRLDLRRRRRRVVDARARATRLSVPLSWGGTRRAAVEVDRTFKTGPLTRLSGSFGIAQRENPHYEIDDRRTRGRGARRTAALRTWSRSAASSAARDHLRAAARRASGPPART